MCEDTWDEILGGSTIFPEQGYDVQVLKKTTSFEGERNLADFVSFSKTSSGKIPFLVNSSQMDGSVRSNVRMATRRSVIIMKRC